MFDVTKVKSIGSTRVVTSLERLKILKKLSNGIRTKKRDSLDRKILKCFPQVKRQSKDLFTKKLYKSRVEGSWAGGRRCLHWFDGL